MNQLKENITLAKLRTLVKSALSKKKRTTDIISKFEKISNYADVLFHTWKILLKLITINKDNGDIYMLNILELLEVLSVSKSFSDTKKNEEILGLAHGSDKVVYDINLFKKNIRKVWQSLINRDLSLVVHKKLLLVLVEFYLSKIDSPLFLTDFLMASMNVKGVIGVLALQGVVTLMQKNNVEYPNIYGKLYSMLEPSIFHAKYKSRLFYLANIFLSSTHLPEILVASFAKRVSRLGLICASSDLPIISRFVGNLLMRHTGLKKMIHSPIDYEVSDDPFLMNENDPMKTHACESSLWEISLLNKHCQPSISSAANFIHFNLPSLEYDLKEVLSKTYKNMFMSECKKNRQKISVTFERPQQTLAKLKDDRLFNSWSLIQ